MSVKLLNPTTVRIPVNGLMLEGELEVPRDAKGLVIFAHGAGSSRFSPRNMAVAKRLHAHKLATLLIDLLAEDEDSNYETRFDVDLLAERLAAITDWAEHDPRTRKLPIGYFGASTGAAAALLAASGAGDVVRAVVSRGGRVDLAERAFGQVTAPTLLIVGQDDPGVIDANQDAFLKLQGKKELSIIPHASHLFEEPGMLDRVAVLAAEWFNEYLNGPSDNRRGGIGD